MQVERTRLYRVRDVAGHFDVSVATIYRAIESGHLRALKLGTGTGALRVTGAAVLAYADACVQAAYQAWFPGGSQEERNDNRADGPAAERSPGEDGRDDPVVMRHAGSGWPA
ncbi:MAG: helix-turn-helix domain-containing protein [Pseudonocardiaceae bacterium]